VRSVVVADVVVVMINTFLSKGWLYLRVDQSSAFSTAGGKKFGEISIGPVEIASSRPTRR
jgi:hypothetical protein